jgi:5'-nucleotidase
MRFLLTNDDGIDAPGLRALVQAAQQFGEVTVLAPDSAHSGCGHRVTTHAPLELSRRGPNQLAVNGTPADCVRLAVHGLVAAPDWVLSGINAGGNLGADVHHSGTVAAVREAVFHGWRGIALSQYHKRDLDWDWDRTRALAVLVLRDLIQRPCPPGCLWNVNFPHLPAGSADPGLVFCPLESRPLPISYRQEGDVYHYNGNYHQRGRTTGSDVDVCFQDQIAISQVMVL